jgi:aspartyl-tRNA synthetase
MAGLNCGIDPFFHFKFFTLFMNRTNCLETTQKVGEEVLLFGWVHVRRNMGKLVFIDLRDRSGLVQVVFVPSELDAASSEAVQKLRPEYVVSITGMVQKRGEKQINTALPTGSVEVLAKGLKILNEAKTPPFEIDNEEKTVGEELRLKYRYLDLRRERMRKNLIMRHKIIQYLRNYLDAQGFLEINTPLLSKSTPEGARDFLVPSRLHPGQFYALPQSPQQYKQILMVAGFERYFQVAPCFRDEDARADRSPGEFYQLDMEVSFMTQEELLQLVEEMFTRLVHDMFPEKHIMQEPWPHLQYSDAMREYGCDKPDLRKDKNDKNELAFAWVVNFPLFVQQTKDDFFHGAGEKYAPSHHMFTAPKEEDVALLDTEPLKVRSYQHDLVLNGFEMGGGSMRIHDAKVQEKVFDLIGFTEKQKEYFSHLLEAFQYGVPPHGGIAPGIDRLVMLLLAEPNIREVIAFPKTSDGKELVMGAPAGVEPEQLKELAIASTIKR